ncbi:MAG: hypothetical protein J7M29_09595 [Verrucomicrobia bacterium]|nr:hypothetical protein [Verrucomicrobiota bacterium]
MRRNLLVLREKRLFAKDGRSGDETADLESVGKRKKFENGVDTFGDSWQSGGTHGNNGRTDMRTKTLLLVAAVGAAGSLALNAQVYSVNAVGYVNVTVPAGQMACLCVPLDPGAANTVADLLPGVPEGTMVYTFDQASGFTINTYMFGEWSVPDQTLSPGQGFFLRNVGTEDLTITFVGEVPQGTLTIDLPAGFSLVGSKVPQAGAVSTDLGLPVEEGDMVYTFDPTAGYAISTFMFGAWSGGEPEVDVAEGFWVRKVNPVTWTREFSIQ